MQTELMTAAPDSSQEQWPLVTIIIPALNEEASIPRLEAELASVFAPLPYRFEFIVIDNGSTDRTPELVKEICGRDPRWKYLRFSRNFTVEMSITAGYRYASGDAMIVLYSDLQDPPSAIPLLLAKWREGYDVVYGVRTVRPGDPKWRNLSVKIAYRLINWFSDFDIPKDTGDFRLITRQVRDALARCGEYNRYMRGLIAWLGFRQTGVNYERRPREAGVSKYPFLLTFFFMINAITSFSLKPLRLFSAFGILMIGVSFLAILVYVILYFTSLHTPHGVTTLIVISLFGLGLNSLGIGILGEYLGRTYSEVKHRPLYLVQEMVNFPEAVRAEASLPVEFNH